MQTFQHVDLAPYHTLAARNASADSLIVLDAPEELAVLKAGDHLLGGGSNTIFAGRVKERLVKPAFAGIEMTGEDADTVILRALAGTAWHTLVQFTAEQGWYGLENLALIPGTAGAAPVQNIGAYGRECADVLESVEVYDRLTGEFVRVASKDCGFSYRQSHFKGRWRHQFAIAAINLRLLKRGTLYKNYPGIDPNAETPLEMFHAICDLRRSKLPDPVQEPNAGSFFHNPIVPAEQCQALLARYPAMPHWPQPDGREKLSAGWLIEKAGLKGVYHDGVGMSAKHALVLINQGADGAAILRHAKRVQDAAAAKFGAALVIEPIVIGEEL